MLIRTATIDDAAMISELVTTVSRHHIASTLVDGGLDHLLSGMTVAAMQQRLQEGYQVFLACDGDVLIGVAAIRLPAHLYYLFVRTECQRQGVGRALWNHVCTWVAESCSACEMTVNSSLNAIGAYERMGFRISGPMVESQGVRYQPMVWRADGPVLHR